MRYLRAKVHTEERPDDCKGKLRYNSEFIALAQAAMLSGPQAKMVVRGCRHCNRWHVVEDRLQ